MFKTLFVVFGTFFFEKFSKNDRFELFYGKKAQIYHKSNILPVKILHVKIHSPNNDCVLSVGKNLKNSKTLYLTVKQKIANNFKN